MTLRWNKEAVRGAIIRGALKGLVRGTESVRTEAIRLILGTAKSGRIYVRRGVEHQASAPGEPPASDTGRLVNSATTEVNASNLTGTVTFRTSYAAGLEFGTNRIAPRPYARPAAANKRDEVVAAVADGIRGELR